MNWSFPGRDRGFIFIKGLKLLFGSKEMPGDQPPAVPMPDHVGDDDVVGLLRSSLGGCLRRVKKGGRRDERRRLHLRKLSEQLAPRQDKERRPGGRARQRPPKEGFPVSTAGAALDSSPPVAEGALSGG